MNTSEVITRIKAELDDQGIFYTDQDVIDALQDTYEDLALKTSCIEKVVSIPASTSPYCHIRSLVPDYYRPLGIFNKGQNEWITPSHYWQMRNYHSQWELQKGTPCKFAPIGFDYIAFYPHYNAAQSDGFEFYYAAVAPDLTSSSTLLLPPNLREVIVDGAISQLLMQALEINKSNSRSIEYITGTQRVKMELDKLDIS